MWVFLEAKIAFKFGVGFSLGVLRYCFDYARYPGLEVVCIFALFLQTDFNV